MKVKSQSEVAQLCPTLSDPMDCGLPGPRRGGHAEALQCWLWDLLQRLHLLPLSGHASDHAQR